ncbi:ferric/cupric-chelate reductase [Entophlyctis luteolus]|nr:ferric/cupric-chelate reductase [Entophlyctis luteolus]
MQVITEVSLALLSVAFFPASWVLVYFMMVHPNWCFADFCVETMGSRRVPVRNTLAIFYCFLAFTAMIAFASKKVSVIRRFLSRPLFGTTTVTIGETSWFSLALFISLIGVPAMIWPPYWKMWASMSMMTGGMGDGLITMYWPWARYVYETLILTTGDSLALILGLCILPVSKNSILASYFDLPYTSILRTHMWLGYALFWMIVFHLIITILSYVLDETPLATLFFYVAPGSPWGQSNYLFLTGMLSFFIFGVVLLTSLSYVRRVAYNLFYLTHFLVFAGVLFAYFHASMSIFYMIPGLCLYALDGTLRLLSIFSSDHVSEIHVEECGYLTVTVATTAAKNAKPGQFMRMNVPAVSRLEFHPWSIVSCSDDSVTFLFARGKHEQEWSARVAEYFAAALREGRQNTVAVHLQGPFGKEIEGVKEGAKSDVLVFYVAGTGIAACMNGIHKVLSRKANDEELPKIHVFWATRNEFMERLTVIQPLLRESKSGAGVSVRMFQTSDALATTRVTQDSLLVTHRPNLKHLLSAEVAPLKTDEPLQVSVFVCGPSEFTRDALESVDAFARGNKGIQIFTEVESFDL